MSFSSFTLVKFPCIFPINDGFAKQKNIPLTAKDLIGSVCTSTREGGRKKEKKYFSKHDRFYANIGSKITN